jgi:thioesterase domain-containing protein
VRICLLVAVVLAGLTASSANAHAAHIYLLRGLANIFSTGLDVLHDELQQRGYQSSVHSYTEYETLAVEAAALEKKGQGPIIIIGHSLGANDAISMAEKMNASHAPVALIVSFGPTVNFPVPANVAQCINYYTGDHALTRGVGFRGTLTNVNYTSDPNINHMNIEKIESLHKAVIARIAGLVARRAAPVAPAAAPAALERSN